MARSKKGLIPHQEAGERLYRALTTKQKKNRAILHPLKGNQAILEMVRGGLDSEEICHIQGAGGEEYVMLPKSLMVGLLSLLQKGDEEKLRLSLEREILQQMPIDFEDVWAVALEEIERTPLSLSSVDTKRLVHGIKRRHPNLFFQLSDLLARPNDEMMD